jgi:hypothetical protein
MTTGGMQYARHSQARKSAQSRWGVSMIWRDCLNLFGCPFLLSEPSMADVFARRDAIPQRRLLPEIMVMRPSKNRARQGNSKPIFEHRDALLVIACRVFRQLSPNGEAE